MEDDVASMQYQIEDQSHKIFLEDHTNYNFASVRALQAMCLDAKIIPVRRDDLEFHLGTVTVHIVGLVQLSIGNNPNEPLSFFVLEEVKASASFTYDFIIGMRDTARRINYKDDTPTTGLVDDSDADMKKATRKALGELEKPGSQPTVNKAAEKRAKDWLAAQRRKHQEQAQEQERERQQEAGRDQQDRSQLQS